MVWELMLIGLLALMMAYLRWGKLNSLVREDPAIWLFQFARTARGELPYRDFSWNYPPLSIFVFGGVLRWFGATFAVVQLTIDVLSAILVFLTYALLRLFTTPRAVRLSIVAMLIAVGATAQTKFTLFSMLTYSPSLLFATIGLLMLLIGVIRHLRSGRPKALNTLLIAAGSFVSLLSKPESALACCCALALLPWLDRPLGRDLSRRRWLSAYGWLLLVSIIPAGIAYIVVAYLVGLHNLRAGVSGYGLATLACPWWPTGLGIFGATASLAQALVIAAVASLPLRTEFVQRYGDRYRRLLLAALPLSALYLGYYAYLNLESLASSRPVWEKLKTVVPALFWTSPVLLPVMWFSICYCCYLGYRVLRRRERDYSEAAELFFLLLVPVAMSSRSLFGTTLYPWTEVSAVCYAFFIFLGPLLLWRFLDRVGPSSKKPAMIVIAAVLVYSLIRIVGGYGMFLSSRHYVTLVTNAGQVRLRDNDGSAEIYRFALANTSPRDFILEIPYGGGINFATGRPGPAFTTEFEQLRMDPELQARDLQRVVQLKPALVLVDDAPRYGSFYGWHDAMNCPFPRLVWKPDEPSGNSEYVFPVIRYLQDHYRMVRRIGTKVVLAPE